MPTARSLAQYLSVDQAARRKRASRQTLYDAIRAGALDVQRIGGHRFIIANDRFRVWRPNPVKRRAGRARHATESPWSVSPARR
jgi:excisionase family DNA binding protein